MADSKEYADLSGGMSDLNAPFDPTSGEYVDNLDISEENTLTQRDGSRSLDDTPSLVATSAGGVREDLRNGSIFNYEEDLHLILRGINKLYAKNAATWDAATAWTKIPSPNTGWEALNAQLPLTASTVISSVLWEANQIMVGRDESSGQNFVTPLKVFLDKSNTFKVQDASLPAPLPLFGFKNYSRVLQASIVLANNLRSNFNTHVADVSLHFFSDSPVSAAVATDEASLIALTVDLITMYNEHADTANSVSASNPHGFEPVYISTSDRFYFKSRMNYLMPDYIKPTNAFECVPLLNKLLFAYRLHVLSFYGRDPATGTPLYGIECTFDNATDTVTMNATDERERHLRTGDLIFFNVSGGAMPTGLTAGTNYYVIRHSSATGTFKLATTLANAILGTAIDFTTNGSGTIVGAAGPTNIHRGSITTVGNMLFNQTYIYPEGFYVTPYTAGTGYQPVLDLNWISDYSNMIGGPTGIFGNSFFVHLASTGAHILSAVRGYLITDGTFNGSLGSTNVSQDHELFAGIMKAHYAYTIHRKTEAATGLHHVASSADHTDSLNTLTFDDYMPSKFVPDPFDKTTWDLANNLWEDLADHYASTGGGNVHQTYNYGGVRHAGVAPALSERCFDLSIGQKRWAIVAKYTNNLYNGKTQEVISAPSFGGSYAIVDSIEVIYNYFIPANIYHTVGDIGDVVKPALYLQEQLSYIQIDVPSIPQSENIPYSSITIEVYETLSGGTTFYLTASYPNNTAQTSILLDNPDTELTALGVEIYTTDGTVPFDEIPRSAAVVRVGDFAFFGSIAEESAPTLQTVTFTATSPGKVQLTAHGFAANTKIVFWSLNGGGPAGGLSEGTFYYVRNPTANDFEVATAPNGTSINFSSTGVLTTVVAKQVLELLPKRVRQSIGGNLLASPEDFFVDMESDVISVGRAQEYPVVVCKQGVYRIEGTFTETGQNGMLAKKLSDRIGGVSANGGITVNDVYYFMGLDGFYRTDGYKVEPISLHLKDRHLTIASQNLNAFSSRNTQVQCSYDRFRNIIYWSVNDSASDNYPNQFWALQLTKSADGRGSFTVYNNSTQFAPTAVGYFRGQLIRGDYQGFFLKHDSSYKNDQKILRTGSGSLVTDTYVRLPYRFRTMADNFGSDSIRKQVFKLFSIFDNTGNLTTAIKSINDRYAAGIQALKGVRFRQEYLGIVKESRSFPVKTTDSNSFQGTRCHHKQVQYEPETVILYASDDYGLANKGAGTATILTGVWPTPNGKMTDYLIYFEDDDYTTGYAITGITSTTVLAIAAGGTSLTNQKWIIKGQPKDELFSLRGLIMYFQGVVQQPMPPNGDSGGNA